MKEIALRIPGEEQLMEVFADFLKVDVANGDAREDTLRSYMTHIKDFVNFCKDGGINPGQATSETVKTYRKTLIERDLAHATISLKLVTVRRFYQGAVNRRMLESNPADGVKPPRKRESTDTKKHLSAGEAEILFRKVKEETGLKGLRDKAIVAMMALEGLRSVEITRANIEDIEEGRILVHGKGKDDYIYPRKDTQKALKEYFLTRGEVRTDEQGTPLFVAVGNRAGGRRLSKDGVRSIINKYLTQAGLKKKGISCHALRHTCGTLLYQATRDVKVVQSTLRHSDVSTAAKYSHIIEASEARYTENIPLEI